MVTEMPQRVFKARFTTWPGYGENGLDSMKSSKDWTALLAVTVFMGLGFCDFLSRTVP